jgi:hypothetical protein
VFALLGALLSMFWYNRILYVRCLGKYHKPGVRHGHGRKPSSPSQLGPRFRASAGTDEPRGPFISRDTTPVSGKTAAALSAVSSEPAPSPGADRPDRGKEILHRLPGECPS